MKIIYSHNLDKSPIKFKRYCQDIEPHGKYISAIDQMPLIPLEGIEYGVIIFNKPLVTEFISTTKNGWKTIISNKFKAKGRELSIKLISLGYDAIVTINKDGGFEEIVSLFHFNKNHKSSNRKII